MNDNGIHFMKKFIQFYNIQSLKINLGWYRLILGEQLVANGRRTTAGRLLHELELPAVPRLFGVQQQDYLGGSRRIDARIQEFALPA